MVITAGEVYRDFVTDGVPSSGEWDPKKQEIRQLLYGYEQIIKAFTSNGGLIYSSLAALNADLSKPANSMAWVMGDAIAANNGVYGKVGAPGTGSWTRRTDLPFSFIIASDAGNGAPNAIQATTSIPVSNSALVWMSVAQANTASPVTVSFNAGPTLTLKTNSGNDITPGGLVAGMIVLGIISGSTFRLVSDQASGAVLSAAEAAAARAESAAASLNIRIATGRGVIKGYDTDVVTYVILNEAERSGTFKWSTGDYSSQISADALEGMFIKSSAVDASVGAWIRQDGWHLSGINPEWFGARSGDGTASFSFDSGDAINAALSLAGVVGASVVLPSGFYLSSKRLNVPSGIIFEGAGTNEAWEIPFFNLASATIHRGATVCFTGTGARDLELDFCSSMRTSGAYRVNPSRPYNNAFDQYFEATDFTNGDASTTVRATLKKFSAAVYLGSDGLSGKTILRNIRFVPACNDGSNGPLAGYLAANMNAYIPWDEWDVGCLNLNPYTTVIEDCQFVGFWHTKGYVQSSIRNGNTVIGGRGEMCILQRNWFQCGVAIRNGDFAPIQSKTASSFTIEWNRGHRYLTAGSTYVDSVPINYTGLTYAAGGNGALTFTGIADTSAIMVAGEDRSITHMTNNNGTTQTVIRDCNIRDFWHPTLVERPSAAFGPQAGKYSGAVEIVGYPVRGVSAVNNTIYTQEPMFWFNMGGRNCFFDKGTFEEKPYRTAIGGAINPNGDHQGLAIVGPTSAWINLWPMLMRGDVTLFGYPWSGRTNIAPVGIVASGRRYSSFVDCFNGYRYQSVGEPTTDKPIIWDARLPRTYTITGTSGVDASVTVYDENVRIGHSGSPNPFVLTRLKAPWYINRVCLSTVNSTDDITLQAGTGAEQFSTGGSNITLFSSLQNIVLVRASAASAWTIEGNYGATASPYGTVTVVGGLVTGGSA